MCEDKQNPYRLIRNMLLVNSFVYSLIQVLKVDSCNACIYIYIVIIIFIYVILSVAIRKYFWIKQSHIKQKGRIRIPKYRFQIFLIFTFLLPMIFKYHSLQIISKP